MAKPSCHRNAGADAAAACSADFPPPNIYAWGGCKIVVLLRWARPVKRGKKHLRRKKDAATSLHSSASARELLYVRLQPGAVSLALAAAAASMAARVYPSSSMDLFTDLLSAINVVEADLFRLEIRASTAVCLPADNCLSFGTVLRGPLCIWLDGADAPVQLGMGDCFLLSAGASGRVYNASVVELEAGAYLDAHPPMEGAIHAGEGAMRELVEGGRLRLGDRDPGWLRGALPPLIHIAAGERLAPPLGAIIQLMGEERRLAAPGTDTLVLRLAEIFLAQVIRAHLDIHPAASGWLAALNDRQLGRAMLSFHAEVSARWTVALLAKAAGMSRSSFAARFRERVGLSPLDYVSRWRMHLVRRDLLSTNLPFTTIAYRHGYMSRTSCSKVFKQVFGHAPAQLRAQQRRAAAGLIRPPDSEE